MKFGTLVKITDLKYAEDKFKQLKDSQFTACQLVYKPKVYNNDDAKIILDAANKYNIEISAQFCGYYDDDTVWDIYYGYETAGINIDSYKQSRIEYVKNAIEFASNLNIKDVIIHAGFVPNDPFSQKYSSMISAVYLLSKHCEKFNMNLLFETGGESPVTLLRLIEDVGQDNLFINFDPANILMYGYGNPVDALKVFGKYVRNVHGKDGMLPKDSRNLGVETPVGDGMVNFSEVFKLFKQFNYDRYVIIEREITGDQQLKDIISAKKYFENLYEKTFK